MSSINDSQPGIKLENLTWKEAESLLNQDSVVVIPLGAQSKEHGLHLPLNNDWLMAEKLTERILEKLPVVVAPTVNYNYYPAMVDYPGSVSLSEKTACHLIIEIVESLAQFGPRNFYVLNTGISTLKVLNTAKESLSKKELLLTYTNLAVILEPAKRQLEEQEGGSHADEIETSIMLALAPDIVNLDLAEPDFHGNKPGPLRRTKDKPGVYSPTGSWGDPTKASLKKGEILLTKLVDGIVDDINNIFNNIK